MGADERTLYVVQSNQNNILAVPIVAAATIGKPRVFADGLHNVPDGAALDANGNLYVNGYATHNISRVSPRGKVALFAADPDGVMLASPTNAAFGGDNFDDL